MDRLLRYIAILFSGLICCAPIHAQRRLSPLTAQTVNWGLNVGVNALSSNYFDVYKEGLKLENTSYTNKVGFTGGGFLRVNLSNFFMQPEFAYCFAQEKFSFEKIVAINTHYHSVLVPVLAGYNIVKESRYLFNVYLGPDFQYRYRTSFNTSGIHFIDKTPKYNINGIIGLSLNISNIFFDFRYEINRPNTDISFSEIPDAPEFMKDISIKKNENTLSFSCGLMF